MKANGSHWIGHIVLFLCCAVLCFALLCCVSLFVSFVFSLQFHLCRWTKISEATLCSISERPSVSSTAKLRFSHGRYRQWEVTSRNSAHSQRCRSQYSVVEKSSTNARSAVQMWFHREKERNRWHLDGGNHDTRFDPKPESRQRWWWGRTRAWSRWRWRQRSGSRNIRWRKTIAVTREEKQEASTSIESSSSSIHRQIWRRTGHGNSSARESAESSAFTTYRKLPEKERPSLFDHLLRNRAIHRHRRPVRRVAQARQNDERPRTTRNWIWAISWLVLSEEIRWANRWWWWSYRSSVIRHSDASIRSCEANVGVFQRKQSLGNRSFTR